MKDELTLEEKIVEATNEVRDNMIEKIKANRAEVDAVVKKGQARYKLQKSKERLQSLESELMN